PARRRTGRRRARLDGTGSAGGDHGRSAQGAAHARRGPRHRRGIEDRERTRARARARDQRGPAPTTRGRAATTARLQPAPFAPLRGGQRRRRRRVSRAGERSRRRTLPVGGAGQSACGSDVSGHSRTLLPRRRAPPHVLNAELLPYLAVDENEPRERKRVQEGADEGGGDGAPGAGRKQEGGSGSEDRERDDQDPHPQRLPPVSREQRPRPFPRGPATQAPDDDERRCEGEAGGADEPGD